jgi:hypothetical protein
VSRRVLPWLRRWWWALLVPALLGSYWLLPISGQVTWVPGDQPASLSWPKMHLDPALPQPGEPVTLRVTDVVPWVHVLLAVDGQAVYPEAWPTHAGDALVWKWPLTLDEDADTLVFYRDCHTGCVERGRLTLQRSAAQPTPQATRVPTKLGVVFADPARDWHGRSGWDVELTYAQMAEEPFWGIDDLAVRVRQANDLGLRVLVRVDYDQGQSLPPANDHLALTQYLDYLRRLARDERLRDVYGYFVGSGYNGLDSNAMAPERAVTPQWYARLFNGYGEPPEHDDNAVQVMRAEQAHARVLVGPVRPWNVDQETQPVYTIEVPWLNYFNALVAAVDEGAREKSAAGIPLAAPDGFALHVPGRPDAPELDAAGAADRADEPRHDLRRSAWEGAQAGFRVYRDWLAIINAYPTTRGRPAFITSSNTFAPEEDIPPAQNYPQGWLTSALREVEAEPQIEALCWFLDADRSGDARWDWFSLAQGSGRMTYVAEEFDLLLQNTE